MFNSNTESLIHKSENPRCYCKLQVCWISNTYYVPMESVIPSSEAPKKEAELTYYQWVPMILLFMALMFKLPRIIWKVLTFSTAISLDKVS